ncbi:MAG: hypothetical protein ACOCY0_03435, partial [Roseicyclus sp.]
MTRRKKGDAPGSPAPPPARPEPFYRIIDIYERQAAEDGTDATIEIAWPGRRPPEAAAPPDGPAQGPGPDAGEGWPLQPLPRRSLAPARGHAARHQPAAGEGSLFVALFDVPPERMAV